MEGLFENGRADENCWMLKSFCRKRQEYSQTQRSKPVFVPVIPGYCQKQCLSCENSQNVPKVQLLDMVLKLAS